MAAQGGGGRPQARPHRLTQFGSSWSSPGPVGLGPVAASGSSLQGPAASSTLPSSLLSRPVYDWQLTSGSFGVSVSGTELATAQPV